MVPMLRHVRRALALTVILATPALSQTVPVPPSYPVKLSGPRLGVTTLSNGVIDAIKEDTGVEVRPMITQFGWQFEKRFYGGKDGLSAITEFVVLAGGLEQNVIIPSFNWLVGVRTREGFEFGAGPNVTPVGTSMVYAVGATIPSGALNFPVNVAIAPTRAGVRVSLLTGITMRQR
jgi:hypothetical protein